MLNYSFIVAYFWGLFLYSPFCALWKLATVYVVQRI